MSVRLGDGETVSGYTVVRFVATGGEGDVYQTRTPGGELVKLKQYAFSASDPVHADHAKRVERLKGIIGIVCPYLQRIYDVFVHNDLYYEVSEWIEGKTLEEQLTCARPLSEEETVRAARCLLEALAALHHRGVIHRDLKPANVILRLVGGAFFEAVLMDFGIHLSTGHSRVTRTGMVGTLRYSSPEMFYGAEAAVDARSDLHQLGVVLFETVSGRYPFGGSSPESEIRAICGVERPHVRAVAPHVSEAFDGFTFRLMQAKPEDRFASAAEAMEQLASLGGLEAIAAPPIPAGAPSIPAAPAAVSGSRFLEVRTGPRAGARIAVPEGGISLGRATVNPADDKISRFHTRAVPSGARLKLANLGATNGLLYEGVRRRKARLEPGDSVILGSTELLYGYEEEGDKS